MTTGKLFAISVLVIMLLSIGSVSAITGKIGNARMVLRAEQGDVIEKSILVINDNDIPLSIKISVSGDLIEDIELIDKEFTLQAGEEKKAYFTITAKDVGTTETNINVQFTPLDGKNGVGLSSTVILIVGDGAGGASSWWDWGSDDDVVEDDPSDTGVTTGQATSNVGKSLGSGGVILVGGLVILFLILLIVLLGIVLKNKKKRQTKLKKSSTAEFE